MRKFLVPRANIENVNVVQPEAEVEEPEAEVEEPPPNVANEFNSNEIVRDPGRRKQIHEYDPNIQDQLRRAYILKGPTQPILEKFPRTAFGSGSRTRAFCKSCNSGKASIVVMKSSPKKDLKIGSMQKDLSLLF
ncbi:zinc finger MYM-type protein [Trifolium repens]|nr:zinc finger MYM-type protein [Trifolium repens]